MKSTDRDDTVLEKNVESLLGQTYDPPRIDTKARERIRAALVGQARPAPVTKATWPSTERLTGSVIGKRAS